MNWKVRVKNPYWWIGLISAVMVPVLAYFGLVWEDLSTWATLGDVFIQFVGNPYLIGLTVLSIVGFFFGGNVDATTSGWGDSDRAMTYDEPN